MFGGPDVILCHALSGMTLTYKISEKVEEVVLLISFQGLGHQFIGEIVNGPDRLLAPWFNLPFLPIPRSIPELILGSLMISTLILPVTPPDIISYILPILVNISCKLAISPTLGTTMAGLGSFVYF
jgi:hypothetical protein